MSEKKIFFSNHAVKQMFQRSISVEEVKFVLQNGVLVNEYPDDKPYPSRLLFAMNYPEAEPRGIKKNNYFISDPEGRGIKPKR